MSLYFFFFKQKTAYEMRISDWSSDVCSSDLTVVVGVVIAALVARRWRAAGVGALAVAAAVGFATVAPQGHQVGTIDEIGRASCRERVCSTCRSRWSPYR